MATVSSEIRGTARITIHEGMLERCTQIVERCKQLVSAHDTGTIEYEFYLSIDGTECVVHERYRDSDAGPVHMANIAPLMSELSDVCSMTGEICGSPSPELRRSLVAAGVAIYELLGRPSD